jgi:hypothetical protein
MTFSALRFNGAKSGDEKSRYRGSNPMINTLLLIGIEPEAPPRTSLGGVPSANFSDCYVCLGRASGAHDFAFA